MPAAARGTGVREGLRQTCVRACSLRVSAWVCAGPFCVGQAISCYPLSLPAVRRVQGEHSGARSACVCRQLRAVLCSTDLREAGAAAWDRVVGRAPVPCCIVADSLKCWGTGCGRASTFGGAPGPHCLTHARKLYLARASSVGHWSTAGCSGAQVQRRTLQEARKKGTQTQTARARSHDGCERAFAAARSLVCAAQGPSA